MEKKEELDKYQVSAKGIAVNVTISKGPGQFVPDYDISLLNVDATTKVILGKIREEFLLAKEKGLDKSAFTTQQLNKSIREVFQERISTLLRQYFPRMDEKTLQGIMAYMSMQNLGMGDVELLLADPNLEEIVINGSKHPVWVYHKRHGWLVTNVYVENDDLIRHYATIVARETGKEITLLNPLLDATLPVTRDRLNATLAPITSEGNTITIRKFATKPWTVVDFIKSNTLPLEAASFLWLAVQYELSCLIVGGTGSGKTSTLNVLGNFFPPNQRIISVEDTRELQLPKTLHWVPMETRLPNPEGKGGVSMLDCVVNTLRMRPDRIVVGEIRRKAEAQVLFEAMHTGHSVYGTLHANTAVETIARLTNPPIEMPKGVLNALSLLLVQWRNRRTGMRRTLELAEINDKGDADVFMSLDVSKDVLRPVAKPEVIANKLQTFTGMSKKEMDQDLEEKENILKALVKLDLNDVNALGYVFAKYYTAEDFSIAKIPGYVQEFKQFRWA